MHRVRTLRLALLVGFAVTSANGAWGRDWPQWRGPERDNLSSERSLLNRWPQGGPKLLWTAKGLGQGYATVSIAEARVYTAGNVDGKTMITALDMSGKTLWQEPNGPAWTRSSSGASGCPTVHKGWLYHESPHGHVLCLDPKTQMRIWSVNILEQFNGRNITWGLSESLLVDGDRVICCPGGEQAGMVALHRKSGKTVWVCEELSDPPGYASPIVVEHGGLRQIVTMTGKAAVGVHASTGKLLWRHEHRTAHDANIPTPIFSDTGHLFIDSGFNSGGALLQLLVKGDRSKVRELWTTKTLDNHHGGVLLLRGYLFGTNHGGEWVCLSLRTGKPTYAEEGIGKGSLTCADGKFYCFGENGTVALVKATTRGFSIISQFQIPAQGKGEKWAHPVVCGGRLYLRHGDVLYCYDVKGR